MSVHQKFSHLSRNKIEVDAIRAQEEELKEMQKGDLKPVTVRLAQNSIVAIDGLAHLLDESRQEVLSEIIFQAVKDAAKGFYSSYENTDECVNEFFLDCSKAVDQETNYASILFQKTEIK